jgi:acylphosphatase
MTTLETTYRGYVTGRVQGVFFRAETQKQARLLGLKGWVRNLIDGRVEFLVCGKTSATEAMQRWLTDGPRLARVDNLFIEQIAPVDCQDFQIVD